MITTKLHTYIYRHTEKKREREHNEMTTGKSNKSKVCTHIDNTGLIFAVDFNTRQKN